ncbi:MAG TPA: cyclohexanecarboxyl-CoA dehydrogenase, partial [Porticoccaceae bacterium]|nr:cyclohexanecarboxyl-CoA dehydrogenase [Porticoccaceae bacterium]
MDFGLSDFQETLLDSVRKFSSEKLAPAYKRREEDGYFDRDMVREMGQLGFLA